MIKTFSELTDTTVKAKTNNSGLNSTDRVFETPDKTCVKVRLVENIPLRNRNVYSHYVLSISDTDEHGNAKARPGMDETQARAAVDEGTPADEVFEVGPQHTISAYLDGEINVQEVIEGEIVNQLNRFRNLQDKRKSMETFMDTWNN